MGLWLKGLFVGTLSSTHAELHGGLPKRIALGAEALTGWGMRIWELLSG